MSGISKELLAATSIPIVLSILSKKESYGYDIIKQVKESSGGKLQFSDGTLYPILRKLEDRGLIISEWRIAENEKRRRYYQITEKGKQQFEEEKVSWDTMTEILNQLWKQTPTELA